MNNFLKNTNKVCWFLLTATGGILVLFFLLLMLSLSLGMVDTANALLSRNTELVGQFVGTTILIGVLAAIIHAKTTPYNEEA